MIIFLPNYIQLLRILQGNWLKIVFFVENDRIL